MKKITLTIIAGMIITQAVFTQNTDANDIQTPEQSPFNMASGSIQGAIANSVKEVTGKANLSVPIANINARGVSYPVSLTYNGDDVFRQAQYMNRYRTQSILGVGWNMNVPKIVVDHKGTATRDDDTFYLLDGNNNTKLICTKKQILEGLFGIGSSYMAFQMEKYAPYKISYRIRTRDNVNSVFVTTEQDYWTITDDKGITYTYGNTDNTRQNVVAWGNWIGDSRNTVGDSKHTTVWNLSKIQDQWGNNLTFSYDKVEGFASSSGERHTEASYLEEITASSGGKIVFTYGNKPITEYYEPHTEAQEPDAYQEQFETKYLSSIKTYDRANQLVYTYGLGYSVIKKVASNDRNRYLQSITQKDKNNTALPPLEYEYHTTGIFEGGLRKVTYPSGGSVSYTYGEKTIFDSGSISAVVDGNISNNYTTVGHFAGQNYALRVRHEGNWNTNERLSIVYDFWIGEKWKRREFIIPELVKVVFRNGRHEVNTLKFASGKDFFAFLTFDRGNNKGSVYLFHKKQDGVDWLQTSYRNITVESGSADYPNEDPVLLAGEDFVAVGTNRPGRLLTYTWNGNGWNSKSISQGTGQFYYGAANNFIVALDEDGGSDWITGVNHADNYYIHYLDAEKQWHTKSWSAAADPHTQGTHDPSYLYASNSMLGFMAGNQEEYILRWDMDYNLIAVDDVVGQHTDTYPLLPVMNNVFMLLKSSPNGPYGPTKGLAFDGSNWSLEPFDPINVSYDYALWKNKVLTKRNGNPYIHRYNPNTDQWTHNSLGQIMSNNGIAVGQHFFMADNHGYRIENTGTITSLEQISNYFQSPFNKIIYNNLSGIYQQSENQGSYFWMNQKDGQIDRVIVPITHTSSLIHANRSVPQLARGTQNFMSSNTFCLNPNGFNFNRIVDGELNKVVKDIVVASIEINNGGGELRTVTYDYNDAHTLPDDQNTFYGKVVVQNRGYGSGNIGTTEKYFNTGEDDVQMAGLPERVVIKNKSGSQVSETETNWFKFSKAFQNTAYRTIGRGYYLRPNRIIERTRLDGQDVTTTTTNGYNTYGHLSSSTRTNSDGQVEFTSTRYAHQEYSFVLNKNMLSFPYETKIIVGSQTVGVEQSIWKSWSGKAYAYQNKSGTTTSNLRINSEITKVDTYGNVQESNNGQGIFKTVLYGYGNLYPVATVTNATFTEVDNQLDVSYGSLQSLSNSSLETELNKLYDRLPQAMINLNLYDNQGRVTRTLDERDEAVNFSYDSFGRLEYTTDSNNRVIEKKEYHFGTH
ncbi:hypothetical protein L0P88_07400 [Muricauda sp. SCSIO 64092]|uniref:SpvB/TcaC N-terminal domain-containing protein n=1 Tax=Allomuricauda sp. SCSIO 64092 TaxID=2908842 RepID=UPI001FF1AA33|nr:hypothetical protein [Muricauda sp. SCSIO 64092]UOY08374.1 hypothetical protein L0P88_07400 [Muricauda sp. SCSIO 64092]